MLFQQILLPSALLPLVAALLVLALGVRFAREPSEERRTTLAGLAVAAAFLTAFLAMTGLPRWPPVEASQRLFVLVLAAGVWTTIVNAIANERLARGGEAVLWAATLPALLETPIRHSWSGLESAAWLGGLFALGLGATASTRVATAQDETDLVRAGVRVALLSGVALALGLSGTARMAQLCGALAAGTFAVEAVGVALGAPRWRRAHALVPTVAAIGLLLIGHFYAELDLTVAALLLLGFLLLGARGSSWPARLAALLPLAIALALVVTAFLRQPDDPYEDYYGALPPTPGPSAPAVA